MENLKDLKNQRNELIKQLRATNDLNKQYRLKRQIDWLEKLMIKAK